MNAVVIIVYFISLELLCFVEVKSENRQIDSLEYIRSLINKIFRDDNNFHSIKRKSGNSDTTKMRYFYEALSNPRNSGDFKMWLRNEAVEGVEETTRTEVQDEFEGLVENELLNALSKKSSALLDRPYVQKKGRNDFLVIRPDMTDPFVTIVPNDIYYNSEKKCVNWLDDCNQKGLRERLLQKVNSPYK
ncbi:unnamed protein product [Euphydryas editha]|uniref:Uncharacterized protein n=1 Tax=Euphydryas editha TaxID=104508 RepID=A0AAU9V2S4_EUPED|nr:unnamed protein product [Euphydryas editha]